MYYNLETLLENMNHATLLGKPGDGKSMTVAHALLKYREKGFTPLFLSSIQDIRIAMSNLNSPNGSDKIVIAIDNAFGSIRLDKSNIAEWIVLIERMEKIVEEKDGDVLVIFTSRRHLFIEIKSAVIKFKTFSQSSMIDMTESPNKYSAEDKKSMLEVYFNAYKIKNCNTVGFEDIDSPHGFPHCVELFCTNIYLRDKGIDFFKNPTQFIRREIEIFQKFDRAKYLLLLLMLIKDKDMTKACLESIIYNPTQEEKKLFRATGISCATAFPDLCQALDALENTYLTRGPIDSFHFTHESLMENVAHVFIESNFILALESLELKYVLLFMDEFINLLSNTHKKTCQLPSHYIKPLNKRITKELQNGNVGSVCSSNLWCNETFIQNWLRYITNTDDVSVTEALFPSACKVDWFYHINRVFKIQCLVRRYIGVKDSGINLNGCDSTLCALTALTFYGRNLAVVAILSNEYIVKNMQHVSNWNGIVSVGLEIACTKDDYLDVVQAYTSLHCKIPRSCMIISRMYSHTEYLYYLHRCSTSAEPFFWPKDDQLKSDCFESIDQVVEVLMKVDYQKSDNLTGGSNPMLFALTDFLLNNKRSSEQRTQSVESVDFIVDVFEHMYDHLCLSEIKEMLTNNGLIGIATDGAFIFEVEPDDDTDILSEVFKSLKHRNVNLNVCDNRGRNIILFVLEKRSVKTCLKVLPQLLDLGVDIHAKDNEMQTALHYLFKRFLNSEHILLFDYLVRNSNLSLSDEDEVGRIPLMFFLQNIDTVLDTGFINEIIRKSPLHYIDKEGRNIFSYILESHTSASFFRNCCNMLLTKGEVVELSKISLHCCFSAEFLDKIKFLIDRADDQTYERFALAVVKECRGSQVIDVLKFLKEKGATFQYVDDNKRNVLHHLFLRYTHLRQVKRIRCSFHDTNVSNIYLFLRTSVNLSTHLLQQDCRGVTPLMLALKYKPAMICKDLTTLDLPVHTDVDGRGYFHYLAESKSEVDFEKICLTLLENHVDINSEDLANKSPLYVCVSEGFYEWRLRLMCHDTVKIMIKESKDRVKIMCKHGATINHQNPKWTKLISCNPLVIELLKGDSAGFNKFCSKDAVCTH